VRRGRKATGLKEIAGLPKCLTESRVALIGWLGFFLFIDKIREGKDEEIVYCSSSVKFNYLYPLVCG
jgi:hypothetical protein